MVAPNPNSFADVDTEGKKEFLIEARDKIHWHGITMHS
jgi:hypothetical protein